VSRKLKVGVIFGGRSGEHEVSLASASSILDALDRERYEPIPIGITREGSWLLSGDPLQTLKKSARDGTSPKGQGVAEAVRALKALDVVFPALHGPYGEDGTLQGFLELLDIPYVGAGVLASALGMDKAAMKQVFIARGLPVVEHLVAFKREWEKDPEKLMARIEEALGYPCFVKPANLGSSVGVSKVTDPQELPQALAIAGRYDRKLLIERALDCREIEVSVLGNDDPQASLPGEIVPKKAWYDYEAKYREGMSDFLIPAPLAEEKVRAFQRLAIEAFQAIDGAGMARVDFFLERGTERIVVNEINTIPGFTTTSVYPKLWAASGLSYPSLLDRLIDLALERHAEKGRRSAHLAPPSPWGG